VQTILETVPPGRYELYRQPKLGHVRSTLVKVAKIFRFLDGGFANYFQVAVPPSDAVKQDLEMLRQSFSSRQSPTATYVGDLGEFCERLQERAVGFEPARFKSTDTGDEIFAYLQDALEVPYCGLIANIFTQQCSYSNHDQASIQAVLMTIQYSRKTLTRRLDALTQADHDDIPAELADGIKARMDVLTTLAEEASWTCNGFDDLDDSPPPSTKRSFVTLDPSDDTHKPDARATSQHELVCKGSTIV